MHPLVTVLVAAILLVASAGNAMAITIIKPGPSSGGNTTAVTDGQNCFVTNAGHYAVAAGSFAPYSWSTLDKNGQPTNACDIIPVLSNYHVIRFMVKRSWAVANNYDYFYLVVTDMANGTVDLVKIYPASLDFVEGPTLDRVVHNGPNTGEDNNVRLLKLECKAQVGIETLVLKAYHDERSINGNIVPAKGTVTARKFDGQASWVGGSSCSPPQGVTAPYAVWTLSPPGGGPVAASWNPATQRGTVHDIEITGDIRSDWWEDIEIDVGLDLEPWLWDCSDGLGASMKYTVPEINVVLADMEESEEEALGEYLFIEAGKASGSSLEGVIDPVLPLDIPDYQIEAEILDASGTTVTRAELLLGGNPWQAPADSDANEDLPLDFAVRALSKSTDKNDTRVRIKLKAGGNEVGGDSCRDSAYFTVVELDVLNPVDEAGGTITTPATGTPPAGNEFTFSSGGYPGTLLLTWRMTTDPDTQDIRDDLEGRMTFDMESIVDSTADWLDAHDLVYQSGEWQSSVEWIGLPPYNSAFGEHGCVVEVAGTASSSAVATIERKIEVFFAGGDADSNYPLSTGEPNWYYYWFQTAAGSGYGQAFGTYDALGTGNNGHAWTDGVPFYEVSSVDLNCHLGFRSNDTYSTGTGFEWDNPGTTLVGIDCFAYSVRHEITHKVILETDWPYGWDYDQDQDLDYLPDAAEHGLLVGADRAANGGVPFDSNFTDTDGDGLPDDHEDYTLLCQKKNRHWVIGSADGEDWSVGGKNWGR